MKIKNSKILFIFFLFAFSLNAKNTPTIYPEKEFSPFFPYINNPQKISLKDPWNMYVGLSFILFNASEENLVQAISSEILALPLKNSIPINMDFKYKPGFKAVLGVHTDLDNWSIQAEYLWLHLKNTTYTAAPSPPGVLYPLYSIPANNSVVVHSNAQWDLGIDFLDFTLSKSMLSGKSLIFKSIFGWKVAFIKQLLEIYYQPTFASPSYPSYNHSSSWGVGPKMGFDTNWVIGRGFKLIGNFSSALLFTKYKILQKENSATNSTREILRIQNTVSYLKPISEVCTGFGWESFSSNFKWYLNLEILYNFSAMFGQNVFCQFLNSAYGNLNRNAFGNLYLHGLILNTKLDF